MQKKIKIYLLLLIGATVICLQSCQDNEVDDYLTYTVSYQLSYPDGYETAEKVPVTLTNATNGTVYIDSTDANGTVAFEVPVGIYNAVVSEKRYMAGLAYIFTGNGNNIVTESTTDIISISLSVSKTAAIIIKELYNGGCPKDNGSGAFSRGQYVILYNNSESTVSLDNICFGFCYPYGSNTTNYFYEDGVLSYESEGWIPAGNGIWYFPDGISLAAGEQIVVAMNSAIDNTTTYSQCINFANADYYAMYDIDDYYSTSYYPTPSSLIPISHYLSAVKYALGSAWSVSTSSPAFFIFATEDETPYDFANDVDNYGNYHGSSSQVYTKVPMEWVIDAIEVYRQGYDNQKRFPASIDAGYVYLTNKNGYTLYRNVDKEETEALEENKGKIVYNYSGGTTDIDDGSTDESGIDAEASIANGARIIYSETNNSTTDFHERSKASLRD